MMVWKEGAKTKMRPVILAGATREVAEEGTVEDAIPDSDGFSALKHWLRRLFSLLNYTSAVLPLGEIASCQVLCVLCTFTFVPCVPVVLFWLSICRPRCASERRHRVLLWSPSRTSREVPRNTAPWSVSPFDKSRMSCTEFLGAVSRLSEGNESLSPAWFPIQS